MYRKNLLGQVKYLRSKFQKKVKNQESMFKTGNPARNGKYGRSLDLAAR
jgi:hypothetical protein